MKFPLRDSRNDPEFRFAAQIKSAVDQLVRSASVPIFAANLNALREQNGIFIVDSPPISGIGSGTLFHIGGHHFLVTAAHVIKQFMADGYELRLGMGKPARPRPIAIREEDLALDLENDVAALRLPADKLNMLSDKRFLGLNDIEFDVEVGDWYCVLFGYLWEGSQPGRDYSQLLLHNHMYWTQQHEGGVSASSYDAARHLLVDYGESSWSLPDGFPVKKPGSLGGISGSSLWRIFRPQHVEDEWSLATAKVIGIENVVYGERIIRCTKWREVMPLLRVLAPSLGTILDSKD